MKSLKTVVCPRCSKKFDLSPAESSEQTVFVFESKDVGIYGMSIKCPHCGYEEEMY